ncbi:MAG: TolC family protein [Hyphomonadaceae bacterium]|nr:TolC family protein [Hyphomonadaceae bacterium]
MQSSLLASIALICTLWSGAASAQTLEEAIENALRANPELGIARAQAQAAREAVPLALSQSLPQVSLNISALEQGSSEPNAGYVRNAPQYWSTSLTTSTLLFSSGSASASRRRARGELESALAALDEQTQRTVLEVTAVYAGVIAARANHTAREQNRDNLAHQLRYVSANVQRGFLTQTDLAMARASAEEAVAALALADLELMQAVQAYERVVGAPPGELTAPGELGSLPGELGLALARAQENNPTIHRAIAALRVTEADVDSAAAQGRARVTLETSTAFHETLNESNIRDSDEDSIALRLSVPIYSGGANAARTARQRALRAAARLDVDRAQLEVRERVTVAWTRVISTRAALTASRARIEAAELAQRGIRREQQAGLRSTLDVLLQEETLLQARTALARAERDHVVAQRELAASVGILGDEIVTGQTPPAE